jgi:hypothetical protein
MTDEDVGTFYWTKGTSQAEVPFRLAHDESSRAVDEICLKELVSLAKFVQMGLRPGSSAVSEMARELGLSRVRAAMRVRLEKALQEAGRDQA